MKVNSNCRSRNVCAQSLSYVWLFATPQTLAHQAPLFVEFPRQECWNGLPFPSPGDLSNPEVETTSLASPTLAGGFFTTWAILEAQEIGIGNIFRVCVCVVKNKSNSLGGLEVISFSCLFPNRRKTRLMPSYYLEAPLWCDYCVPETASLMTLERELAQGLGALLSWQSALPWPVTRRPSQCVSHTW